MGNGQCDTFELRDRMMQELRQAFQRVEEEQLGQLLDEICQAKRVFVYGLGRERLMLQAFAMRLMHLGLTVHVVGDVTTPRIGEGDLFLTSSGTGYLATVEALMKIARTARARIAFFTAATDSPLLPMVDQAVLIPARTMRDDRNGTSSVQPMGTLFEQVQLMLLDMLAMRLKERLGRTETDMVELHTNLE
ncbi:6-phospho-3-hexuloisomerase [Alicyclobacillus kakegawensis]|uniref:6-phospho-3-hexuloisomerase n=1 Tax=Alicyclobacillus kakegawensis TaxID=392012 RepID=UPI000832F255|nr:6-phospho-3-hexuloisomerase [Alicyclobacillus kakegawensis]